MISEWLVRRFVGPGDPDRDHAHRARYGALEGWVSVAVNVLLFVVKGAMGVITGSIAVVADAVHSLSDTATSGVVIFGFRMAGKPSDEEHPFGHGRAEPIATLVVAVLLIVVGVEFLRSSVSRLLHPRMLQVSWAMVAVLAGTVVMKEWLARFSRGLARRIKSDALEADSWHHRTDSISTGFVIAGFVLSRWGFPWVDGVAGLAVSTIIAWIGFDIGRRAVNRLLGQAPTEEEAGEIRATALSVDGVEGVHEVLVHTYGNQRAVSLHIEVSADLSALELHSIADEVESVLSLGRNTIVVVHVDPIDRNHPHYEEIRAIVEGAVRDDDRCYSFHDLRIVGTAERFQAILDLAVPERMTPRDEAEVMRSITARVQERFPEARVVICVEPAFVRRTS